MNEQPLTLTAAASVLRDLGIGHLDELSQKAIERVCLEQFLWRVSICQSGNDQDGVNRRAIEQLLKCLSIETIEAIFAIGLTPNLDRLAAAGIRAPTKLLSAIAAAGNIHHVRHGEAKAHLVAVLSGDRVTAPNLSVVPQIASQPLRHEIKPPEAVQSLGTATQQERPRAHCAKSAPAPIGSPAPRPGTQYESEHVYGQNFALTFNASIRNGHHGIMVDAAVATGPSHYNWANAIHVMLDAREVATALAVFKRRSNLAEFKGHGNSHEKCFSLEYQQTHFFARVVVRGQPPRAVPITRSDAVAVSLLFVKQLGREYPDVPIDTIIDLVMDVNDVDAAPEKGAA